jgi:DNA-binding response OmpR family regulator
MPTPLLFQIDLERRDTFVRGKLVHLPPKQFDILAELKIADGRPVSREAIVEKVWKAKPKKDQDLRFVDQHVARLRRNLRVPVVETVVNYGYKFRGL